MIGNIQTKYQQFKNPDVLDAILSACDYFSKTKTGALIVIDSEKMKEVKTNTLAKQLKKFERGWSNSTARMGHKKHKKMQLFYME